MADSWGEHFIYVCHAVKNVLSDSCCSAGVFFSFSRKKNKLKFLQKSTIDKASLYK